MPQKTLTTSYLALLSNANHDGVTTQIYDRLVAYETANQLLIAARDAVGAARTAEDAAYVHYSNKDFASDDLKAEDTLEDNYMSTVRALLNAFLNLPETEPLRRKAQLAVQVFKDFNFRVSDGFEAEARKTVNMYQEWTTPEKYDLDALGIRPWIEKANTQALKVLQLINIRIDNEAAKVKGEQADARKATDEAIRRAYDIINALAVLEPSAGLTTLINTLLSIEERAKLYYISSGSSGSSSGSGSQGGSGSEQGGEIGGDTPPSGGDDDGGGDTPPSGGDDNGGGDTPPSGGDDNGGGETPPAGGDDNGGGDNNGGGGNNLPPVDQN